MRFLLDFISKRFKSMVLWEGFYGLRKKWMGYDRNTQYGKQQQQPLPCYDIICCTGQQPRRQHGH